YFAHSPVTTHWKSSTLSIQRIQQLQHRTLSSRLTPRTAQSGSAGRECPTEFRHQTTPRQSGDRLLSVSSAGNTSFVVGKPRTCGRLNVYPPKAEKPVKQYRLRSNGLVPRLTDTPKLHEQQQKHSYYDSDTPGVAAPGRQAPEMTMQRPVNHIPAECCSVLQAGRLRFRNNTEGPADSPPDTPRRLNTPSGN
ncbi:hypothetical protein BaRGS_00037289, partial [Batillaria attramentaria]